MYDSERFNGFVKNELDNYLIQDILNFFIFNESDMHAAVYYYIRTYFEKRGTNSSDENIVRCKPVFEDMSRPDIVIFKKYNPIYIMEFKMFTQKDDNDMSIDSTNDKAVIKDLDKMKKLMKDYPSITWGFMVVVYDSDERYDLNDAKLKRTLEYKKMSIIAINIRRQDKDNRKRNKYDEWRKQYNKYLDKHF